MAPGCPLRVLSLYRWSLCRDWTALTGSQGFICILLVPVGWWREMESRVVSQSHTPSYAATHIHLLYHTNSTQTDTRVRTNVKACAGSCIVGMGRVGNSIIFCRKTMKRWAMVIKYHSVVYLVTMMWFILRFIILSNALAVGGKRKRGWCWSGWDRLQQETASPQSPVPGRTVQGCVCCSWITAACQVEEHSPKKKPMPPYCISRWVVSLSDISFTETLTDSGPHISLMLVM